MKPQYQFQNLKESIYKKIGQMYQENTILIMWLPVMENLEKKLYKTF